jgi:hypothetical protein
MNKVCMFVVALALGVIAQDAGFAAQNGNEQNQQYNDRQNQQYSDRQ